MKIPELSESTNNFVADSATNLSSFDKSYFLVSTGILAFSVTFIKDIIDLKNSAPLWLLIIGWIFIAIAIAISLVSFFIYGHVYKDISIKVDEFNQSIKKFKEDASAQRTEATGENRSMLNELDRTIADVNRSVLDAATNINKEQSSLRAASMISFSIGLAFLLIFIAWSLSCEKKSILKNADKGNIKDSLSISLKPDTIYLKMVDNKADFVPPLTPLEKPFVLQHVYFDNNKTNLRPESFKELDSLVSILRANPTRNIEIAAFTDNKGSDLYNLNLRNKRALAVKGYIVSKGISQARIIAKGYGKASPIADNRTYEGRQFNRRVEFKFQY